MDKVASIFDYARPGLDPTVWGQDGKLLPKNHEQIVELIHSFLTSSGFKHYNEWVESINIVGSITTYQYISTTDIDVHMFANLDKFIELENPVLDKQSAADLLDAFRKDIDKKKIMLDGTRHPIELYFETELSHRTEEGTGVYSIISSEWLKDPIVINKDFDIEESKPKFIEEAADIAGEIDMSFGDIKRQIKRIEDLQETIAAWSKENRKLFQDKLNKKMDAIEAEIDELLKVREKIVEDRRGKNYSPASEQEIKFKYLQKFGYLALLGDLKDLLEKDEEITEENIEEVKEIVNKPLGAEASLKMIASEKQLFIDFDNTIAKEKEDHQIGTLMPGAKEALDKFKEDGWSIVIYSVRANDEEGRKQIEEFLAANDIPYDDIFVGKPEATFYIDDHGIKFTDWNSVKEQISKKAGKVRSIETEQGPDVKIIENPNPTQVSNLFRGSKYQDVRYLVDSNGNLFMWDAYLALHYDVITKLGLREAEMGELTDEDEALELASNYVDFAEIGQKVAQKGVEYDFSSTQINLPKDISQKIVEWSVENIPNEDLYDDHTQRYGRELESHVTVLYGLETNDAKPVEDALKGEKAFTIKLGKTKSFETKTGDAVVISVDSPELHKLHEMLAKLPHSDLGLEYHPHITIAYVKEGHGKNYADKDFFEGIEVPIDTLTFSPKEGDQVSIEFKSQKKASANEYWIDPNGTFYDVDAGHERWIIENYGTAELSSSYYDIDQEDIMNEDSDALDRLFAEMLAKGWIRIGSPNMGMKGNIQFSIEMEDMRRIPRYLEDFVASHMDTSSLPIAISDQNNGFVEVTPPFSSLQKAVNRELMHKRHRAASSKAKVVPIETMNIGGNQVKIVVGQQELDNYLKSIKYFYTNPNLMEGDDLRSAAHDAALESALKLTDFKGEDPYLYASHVRDAISRFTEDMFDKKYGSLKVKAEFLPTISTPAPDNIWQDDSDLELPVKPDPISDEDTYYQPSAEKPRKNMWKQILDGLFGDTKKEASLAENYWVDPQGKEYPFSQYKMHIEWIHANHLMLEKQYGYDFFKNDPPRYKAYIEEGKDEGYTSRDDGTYDEMIDSGWTRVNGSASDTQFMLQVKDLKQLPKSAISFIENHYDPNDKKPVYIVTNRGSVLITDPFPNVQKAVFDSLRVPMAAALKEASFSLNYWLDPNGQEYEGDALKQEGVKPEQLIRSGWVNITVPSDRQGIVLTVDELEFVPDFLNAFLAKTVGYGDPVTVKDMKGSTITLRFPFKNIRGLIKKHLYAPDQEMAASLKVAERNGYWLSPDGKEIKLGPTQEHAKVIKQYGLTFPDAILKDDWVRIRMNGDEAYVEVRDVRNIPAGVESFFFKHPVDHLYIEQPHHGAYVEVSTNDYMESTLQEEVNHQLKRRHAAMLRYADATDEILKAVKTNGGVTWNLSQGNLSGQKMFAVSIYLDDSLILDHEPTKEDINAYIFKKQNLLNKPENSLGIWHDTGSNKYYLDVVVTLADRDQAIALGKQHNQKAIFDLATLQEIPTGGTGEVTSKLKVKALKKFMVDGIPVFENPSIEEVRGLLRRSKHKALRVFVAPWSHDVYVWDAYDLNHNDVYYFLGFTDDEISEDALHVLDDERDIDSYYPQIINSSKKASVHFEPTSPELRKAITLLHSLDEDQLLDQRYVVGLLDVKGMFQAAELIRNMSKEEWEDFITNNLELDASQDKESGYYGPEDNGTEKEYFSEETDDSDLGNPNQRFMGRPKGPYRSNEDEVTKMLFEKDATVKVAFTAQGYWLAPDGQAYDVRKSGVVTHGNWVEKNKKLLKTKYGFSDEQLKQDYFEIAAQMLQNGWVRVGDLQKRGFGIELADIRRIPSYVEDFMPTVLTDGDHIIVADLNQRSVEVDYPWKSLQAAVRRGLRGNKVQAGGYSNTYTDEQGEQFFNEQHEYANDPGGGGGFTPNNYNNSSTDYPAPKDMEPVQVFLDKLEKEKTPPIPSYEVSWYDSLPKE